MNRAYAFNRDKGRCGCCKCDLQSYDIETHHKNPKLSLKEINQVKNLITVCKNCHKAIHAQYELDNFDKLTAKKINKFRNILKND